MHPNCLLSQSEAVGTIDEFLKAKGNVGAAKTVGATAITGNRAYGCATLELDGVPTDGALGAAGIGVPT